MSTVEIKPGLVVIFDGKPAKILSCLPESQVSLQIKDGGKKQVDVDDLVFIPILEAQKQESFENRIQNATPSEIEVARLRFNTITEYREQRVNIDEALTITGLNKARFYELLKRFDSDVGIESMLRFTRGRKSGVSLLSNKQEKIISDAIKKIYKGKGVTYRAVWDEVELTCKEQFVEIPSLNTVKKRVQKLGVKETHRLKHGAESANQLYEAKPGWLETERPFEYVQMDHTLVDLIVCDELTRKPLGRPWLTILVDMHTRVILGYYLSLHAPSTLSVACAITHAVMPKKKYLENIGRADVQYPFYGCRKFCTWIMLLNFVRQNFGELAASTI